MSFFKRLHSLWYPERFQGWGRNSNYFEGWYFKLVDAKGEAVYAFIPGIAMDASGAKHAFIQVLDGINREAAYHRFEATDFKPEKNRFAVQLGDNFFAADRIRLNIPGIEGELLFSELTYWPKFLYAPGIMGWFSFIPFMECYHGIVSLNHQLEGTLRIKGQDVSFDGGKGYTEKDWGRSFPNAWIWLQTNHFEGNPGMSLTASVANIPWIGSHFIGYIVGLLWKGKVYRFATYTGAMMKADLKHGKVFLSFKDRRYRLEIIAEQTGGAELISPVSGDMKGKVNESIQATVNVHFFEKERLVFEGDASHGGLEIAGLVDRLLTQKWRR